MYLPPPKKWVFFVLPEDDQVERNALQEIVNSDTNFISEFN